MANASESDTSQAGRPVSVKGMVLQSASSFNRPADTTAYASGDLVANSTTANAVAAMQFELGVTQGIIRAAMIKTSNANLAAGSSFRLHLFSQVPVPTGGDNAAVFAAGAALVPSDGYLGYVDMTVDVWGSNGAMGHRPPVDQPECLVRKAAPRCPNRVRPLGVSAADRQPGLRQLDGTNRRSSR